MLIKPRLYKMHSKATEQLLFPFPLHSLNPNSLRASAFDKDSRTPHLAFWSLLVSSWVVAISEHQEQEFLPKLPGTA